MSNDSSGYGAVKRPRPISVPQMHHATFMTQDVDAMVRFYELVCGLQPVFYSQHAAWLTNDAANHRIALLAFPGVKAPVDKPHTAGLHHIAFEYATFDQWLDNYIRLRDLGIVPAICLDHGMTISMYYVDPDGNGVEIQVDTFRDWGLSKEWMWASKEFSSDQIGPQFDPEKLVAAREAGQTPDEIHKKAYAGKFLPDNPRPDPSLPDVWPAKLATNRGPTGGPTSAGAGSKGSVA